MTHPCIHTYHTSMYALHTHRASNCDCAFVQFAVQELILFSRADLERSIPSMVDGLKPGQRKILFCCFKRNLRKDIKVCVCVCVTVCVREREV